MYINNYKEKDGWNWAWLDQRHSWVKSLFKDAIMTSWLSIDSNYGWWFCFSSGISWTIFFFLLILAGFKYFKVRKCICGIFSLQNRHNYLFPSLFPCPFAIWLCNFFLQNMGTIFFLSLSWIRLRMWLALTNVEVTLYQFWVWPSRELSSFSWNPTAPF